LHAAGRVVAGSGRQTLPQHVLILSVMQAGRDYSFQELQQLTGLPPHAVSARINALRERDGLVERADKRRCSISGVLICPHRRVSADARSSAAEAP
jgi:hypothetical protein